MGGKGQKSPLVKSLPCDLSIPARALLTEDSITAVVAVLSHEGLAT